MPRADMSRAWKERPISTFFATGGGIGMIPFAPGTWGSLEGIVVFFLAYSSAVLWKYESLETLNFTPVMLVVLVLLTTLGIVVSNRVEELTEKDPGPVVIDEVVGQYLALAVPAYIGLSSTRSPLVVIISSFLLFRLFDIWKPGPIRKLQDLPGGWGIMLDDVAAGILAGVMTYGIGRLL